MPQPGRVIAQEPAVRRPAPDLTSMELEIATEVVPGTLPGCGSGTPIGRGCGRSTWPETPTRSTWPTS